MLVRVYGVYSLGPWKQTFITGLQKSAQVYILGMILREMKRFGPPLIRCQFSCVIIIHAYRVLLGKLRIASDVSLDV